MQLALHCLCAALCRPAQHRGVSKGCVVRVYFSIGAFADFVNDIVVVVKETALVCSADGVELGAEGGRGGVVVAFVVWVGVGTVTHFAHGCH